MTKDMGASADGRVSASAKLLCRLGLHRWSPCYTVHGYEWIEDCLRCGKQRSGWTFY